MAAIESISAILPQLIGGSADLSGSNNTKTNNSKIINSKNFNGNYIHYGVREHGMAAVMNGLALYGGIVPYGGNFLNFFGLL
jgi:transketolase